MLQSLKPLVICLKISAYIYYLTAALGLLLLFAPTGDSLSMTLKALVIILSALMGFGVMKLPKKLNEGRRWAWGVSYLLSLLYLPSIFLPLGIIQLYGLLRKESYVQFHLSTKRGVFLGIAILYCLLVIWLMWKINAA